MRVSPFGVSPEPAHRERDRLEDPLDAGAGFVGDRHRRRPAAREAEDGALALGDLAERLRAEAADRLAADPSGLDEPGRAQALEVMADERLRQADMGDQVVTRGLALGEPAHDAQAVDVGEGLVEGAQVAQVIGLDDDRRDGRADPGGRGHGRGGLLGPSGDGSASHQPTVDINGC